MLTYGINSQKERGLTQALVSAFLLSKKMDNYVIIKNGVPKELQFMGYYLKICMIESRTIRGKIEYKSYFDYVFEYAYILAYYSV